MKMKPEMFADLQRDMRTVQEVRGRGLTSLRDAWDAFWIVCRDRQYDDSHPGYAENWTRHVPYRGRGEGMDSFYRAGLNDSHIETALRQIMAA